MIDIKWLIQNLETARQSMKNRGSDYDFSDVIELNEKRKSLQAQFDQLRSLQNQKSKEIGAAKKTGQDASLILNEMQTVAEKVKSLGEEQTAVEADLNLRLLSIPNIPHSSVPVGTSADQNVVLRTWGEPRKFDFKPKEHWQIGEDLGLLDFERAAKIAGARFALYRGSLAKLERAIIQLMLEIHTERHGYEELLPPLLVNADSLTGTGNLPKFEEDLFKTTVGYYLIPTAEVPVTNIHRDETVDTAKLPMKFCAYTPCFRSEAGSAGKDTKGLIRQHQFNKVEIVKLTDEDTSYEEHNKLTRDAETILEELGLPYRTVVLCTGDMGFGSARTHDIEVWLPGQNAFREISSCSNFESFQARRMNTRYRAADGSLKFVHTLNGSGLAVGRTLVAILENYQNSDGSVTIPSALQKFMGTDKIIKRS